MSIIQPRIPRRKVRQGEESPPPYSPPYSPPNSPPSPSYQPGEPDLPTAKPKTKAKPDVVIDINPGDPVDAVKLDATVTKKSDFWDVLSSIATAIPFKMAFLLFFIFLLINSTIFIEYIIEPMGKSYYDNSVTEAGTYMQGLFLASGYMIMYALTANEIV